MPVHCQRIDLEALHGDRAFELWQGDMTVPDFSVDIMAMSYSPLLDVMPHFFMGALQRRYGIQPQVWEFWVQFKMQQHHDL